MKNKSNFPIVFNVTKTENSKDNFILRNIFFNALDEFIKEVNSEYKAKVKNSRFTLTKILVNYDESFLGYDSGYKINSIQLVRETFKSRKILCELCPKNYGDINKILNEKYLAKKLNIFGRVG